VTRSERERERERERESERERERFSAVEKLCVVPAGALPVPVS
jgi:hypothetical protein